MQANYQLMSSFQQQQGLMASYRIVFKGEILPGKRKDIVMLDFAERFKVPTGDQLKALFSGELKVLKKGIDENTAIRFVKALESIGVKAKREIEVPEVSSHLELTDNFFDTTPVAAPQPHTLPEHYPQRLSEKLELARGKSKKTVSPVNTRRGRPTPPFSK
ncbi:hypothetical protein [Halioxenophilus aromaticivorans]|uniref:Uncharacterized protein n=1 Tax=Halioxenophilus aromaticivorans TaxID=1306992 RepID=A0AAV3TYH6_9ALTE